MKVRHSQADDLKSSAHWEAAQVSNFGHSFDLFDILVQKSLAYDHFPLTFRTISRNQL